MAPECWDRGAQAALVGSPPAPLSGAPARLAALLAVADAERCAWQVQATHAAPSGQHSSGCRQGIPDMRCSGVHEPPTPAREPVLPGGAAGAASPQATAAAGPRPAAAEHTR